MTKTDGKETQEVHPANVAISELLRQPRPAAEDSRSTPQRTPTMPHPPPSKLPPLPPSASGKEKGDSPSPSPSSALEEEKGESEISMSEKQANLSSILSKPPKKGCKPSERPSAKPKKSRTPRSGSLRPGMRVLSYFLLPSSSLDQAPR